MKKSFIAYFCDQRREVVDIDRPCPRTMQTSFGTSKTGQNVWHLRFRLINKPKWRKRHE
jgi:hypothetical protein